MASDELKEVRVFAPATVANVACGYDVLGFALEAPGDEVVVRFTGTSGLRISSITGDQGKLPLETDKNTASVSALALLENLGKLDCGIEMEIHKKMPFNSGLGSSAASAVAGVFAINVLLGEPKSRRELLPFAMEGESHADGSWHADNVSPSLLGGFVLVRDNAELDVLPLPVPEELIAVVVHPDLEIPTAQARELVPQTIPTTAVTRQVGNLGGLICGLMAEDYDLIGRSLTDVIAEPARKSLITGFDQARQAALEAGALGFSISGAGPSVFALCEGQATAEVVSQAIQTAFTSVSLDSCPFVSSINREGVRVLSRS